MYIALTYIGKDYTPGEIIRGNLPDDQVKWLLEAGAIRRVASAPAEAEAPEINNKSGKTPDETEREWTRRNDAAQLHDVGYNPDGTPLTPETPDEETGAEDGEPEDEHDEEAENIEINAMDGLVAAAPETEEKTSQTATRRSAVRKPSAKTGTKGGKTR